MPVTPGAELERTPARPGTLSKATAAYRTTGAGREIGERCQTLRVTRCAEPDQRTGQARQPHTYRHDLDMLPPQLRFKSKMSDMLDSVYASTPAGPSSGQQFKHRSVRASTVGAAEAVHECLPPPACWRGRGRRNPIVSLIPPTTAGGWTLRVLHGTTTHGGHLGLCYERKGCGTIFKLTPPVQSGDEWTLTRKSTSSPDPMARSRLAR